MDPKIENLTSTTFCGRRFRRQQIADIQVTVKTFSNLSRCELALTICEHLNWVTPRGTNKINTCLNALEEMEALGIIVLPAKIEQQKKTQKKLQWSDQTNEPSPIDCALDELIPLTLQTVTDKEQTNQWNEFVDRYHYLGYRRPIGSHLRYFVIDRQGRKLGCLLFSFATLTLTCRDQWIGWTPEQRQKHLNLVINNNRFLIFPWVNVKHLASKVLSSVVRQIDNDWEVHHGYRPVLIETFVDPDKYKGTCYKAANWQHIGKTTGRKTTKNPDSLGQKEVYIYPLTSDIQEALMDKKKSPSKKAQPFKTANIPTDSQVYLWQKIITVVADIADSFDREWQKRRRVVTTLLVVLFIFRLIFSKNKQGYGSTIAELWEYCEKLNIPLPQEKPVVPATFCNARKKIDESIFKLINTKIIQIYEKNVDDYRWNNHRIFAVDGSKINLPKQLVQFNYQTPSGTAYYPQGLISCLYQLKSKIPFDFELSPHGDERKLARGHLDVLQKDDIVVYDRGYFSYAMLLAHHDKGIHAVFRLPKSTFKEIDEFMLSADMERLIIIEPNAQSQQNIRRNHPDIQFRPLQFRLIKYIIEDTTYTIGTTLLDAEQYKASEFSDIYHSRWGIEELYKVSKVFIDIEDFHAQTERGVKQELYAHFVIITLSRIFSNHTDDVLLLNQSSDKSEKMKTNFKNCLATMARNIEGLLLRQVNYIKETLVIIGKSVLTCFQKERPNRSYVRESKKPVKKWRSRSKHRGVQDIVPVIA